MKIVIPFIVLSFFVQTLQAQKQTFDRVAYTAPKGWTKSNTAEAVIFTKDGGSRYCVISLCKSIEATANAQENFDHMWQIMAKTNLGAGEAQMQPGSTDKGWETKIGSAPFEKDGLTGSAILINSSKNNRQVNILIITNTDAYLKEMETFLESIDLKEPNTSKILTKNNTNAPATEQSTNNSKDKPEMWAGWRNSNILYNTNGSVNLGEYDYYKHNKLVIDRYLIYPNGDFFPEAPWQGLVNFDKSNSPESWGRFSMQGAKGKFKSKYIDIVVTKKSATQMIKDDDQYSYYKYLPVDGLQLEGAYNYVSPNWGKDPQLNYLDKPGCQYVIYFKKDGTFDDKGIFYTGPMPNKTGNCNGGTGTYNIENFTITFKYNDGRVVYRLFTVPPTRNPATYDETIYIGESPYYKKFQ